MDMNFREAEDTKQNKNTIILTGPCGNLGRPILSLLLKSYNVIGISRNASSFKENPERRFYYPLDIDLFQEDSLEECLKEINSLVNNEGFNLVGLVNNALLSYPSYSVDIRRITIEDCSYGVFGFHIAFSIKLAGSLLKRGSSIINITSMYGKVSPKHSIYANSEKVNPLLYGSFKASLIQATKWLSSYLGENNIRVNSVSYGPFPSESAKSSDPSLMKELAKSTHLRRVGEPKEAAGIIEFLLSEKSSFITGEDISVDGGWTAW
tara:strand:- start:1982 stop:2776 length:795 start_codon:yes stop_codon:yes gene_type:complete